jgi:hypothetical protein
MENFLILRIVLVLSPKIKIHLFVFEHNDDSCKQQSKHLFLKRIFLKIFKNKDRNWILSHQSCFKRIIEWYFLRFFRLIENGKQQQQQHNIFVFDVQTGSDHQFNKISDWTFRRLLRNIRRNWNVSIFTYDKQYFDRLRKMEIWKQTF